MSDPNPKIAVALADLLLAVHSGQDLSPEASTVRQAYAALGSELELTPSEAEEYVGDLGLVTRKAA